MIDELINHCIRVFDVTCAWCLWRSSIASKMMRWQYASLLAPPPASSSALHYMNDEHCRRLTLANSNTVAQQIPTDEQNINQFSVVHFRRTSVHNGWVGGRALLLAAAAIVLHQDMYANKTLRESPSVPCRLIYPRYNVIWQWQQVNKWRDRVLSPCKCLTVAPHLWRLQLNQMSCFHIDPIFILHLKADARDIRSRNHIPK